MLAEAIYDDAMAFPSERKGLSVLLGFNDPFRKETLLDRSSLTQAASDYLRFLSPLARRGPRPKAPNSGIVALLENQVMHGKADFHGKAEPLVFGFTGEHGPTVQMNASASFVRSLAGLDLYLRTVAGDDVLVIDEPEMNAHPEAQIQLVELFAIMANQGRHVIVTTHSPYFVDHLNNLMQGATLSEEAKIRLSDSLKLRDKGAFITADNAAVYLFREDGEVRDLVRDEVIDVSSFANETDYLSRIYAQIVEAEKLQKGHPHAE